MRRLASFFDSVGLVANLLYWLSLWWMGMIVLLFLASRCLLQNSGALDGLFPTSMSPAPGGAGGFTLNLPDEVRRNLVPMAHTASFLWLALVGWTARRMEKRIGTGPQDLETRFLREEAERRSVRWMLWISIPAAWLIPVGAGILLAIL